MLRIVSRSAAIRPALARAAAAGSVRFQSDSSTSSHQGSDHRCSVHPTSPVRTRFAPSPTGYLHLGSLRTALYNFLVAKNTGGSFILRLEDTDQKRLVADAERNIYESLEWCGITIDEGPNNRKAGDCGPYRQSDRRDIYAKYLQVLLDAGKAYKCYCSKPRLDDLRASAMKLKPPTTVTYDRHCYKHSGGNESEPHKSNEYVVRFKSPDKYPSFVDLIHGKMNLQPQVNQHDRRYDDFVLMKSDGLPTYHFANVVDDHLMGITHVIRGEEWITSSPKHVALYDAFGWTPPQFVHIPLLTTKGDKKLSKRSGDIGILLLRDNQGILPEAMTNFVALFGWSPPRLNPGESTTEVMTMQDLISSFSLDHLTKGNAKVTDEKLKFFNKSHLQRRLSDPGQFLELVEKIYPTILEKFPTIAQKFPNAASMEYVSRCLAQTGPSLTAVNDIATSHSYLFEDEINYKDCNQKRLSQTTITVIERFLSEFGFKEFATIVKDMRLPQKDVFMSLRFALAGGKPGLTIPVLIDLLGEKETAKRCNKSLAYLSNTLK